MASNSYYVNTLSWSVLEKIINALIGFISTPLLLGGYGKADYGILSLATACNGYMHLLDLGMNVGAVRFFSIWLAQDERQKLYHVARTNITFYSIISFINILGLLLLAWFGEPLFSITHSQFVILRSCLYILSFFNLFSWVTTTFNQLLIADKQMAYTMQMKCVMSVLRICLLILVFFWHIDIVAYFGGFTFLVASLVIPFSIKCKRDKLIDSFLPAFYWKEFKPVLLFSLSIFALSLFQMTATQTRPIILGMFSEEGASSVTDFSILSVFPSLVIMIGATFSGIFLPQTSEMVAKNDRKAMEEFAYKWTKFTTIIINILCFPFILGGKDAIVSYVGLEYESLYIWLVIWILTVLCQMHTTPGNALVLAYGRTKLLVTVTAVACIISIVINVVLSKYWGLGAGSAIIAYGFYVFVIIGLYYISFYKRLLGLSRKTLFVKFLFPTLVGCIVLFLCYFIPFERFIFWDNNRLYYLAMFIIKAITWLIPYLILLFLFKIITIKEIKYARI